VPYKAYKLFLNHCMLFVWQQQGSCPIAVAFGVLEGGTGTAYSRPRSLCCCCCMPHSHKCLICPCCSWCHVLARMRFVPRSCLHEEFHIIRPDTSAGLMG
jgi:hypothetical protein